MPGWHGTHAIIWRVRQALARPRWALARIAVDLRSPFVWSWRYRSLREPKRAGAYPHDRAEQVLVRRQLVEAGFDIRSMRIDLEDYRRFLERATYEQYPLYYGGGQARGFPQKALEHYLALKLLRPGAADVCIDVASQKSPAPQIYARLSGAHVFSQDLAYPGGLSGDRIGGDASRMPVADGFASAIALHNAFEHFEGDADARFIREAGRVLRPGGRLCIAPLFLASRYVIQTDPAVWPAGGMAFEPEAEVACVRGWRDRHGRFYDVPRLRSRVRDNLDGLRLTIFDVENAADVHADVYLRFVALIEKPE